MQGSLRSLLGLWYVDSRNVSCIGVRFEWGLDRGKVLDERSRHLGYSWRYSELFSGVWGLFVRKRAYWRLFYRAIAEIHDH